MRSVDLTGQKFGRLTVVRFDHKENGRKYYLCQCDCGNFKIVSNHSLKSGNTKSCGCLHKEILIQRNKDNRIHHPENERLLRIWRAILHRCYKETDEHYDYYGGRGIKVCDDWHNFETFQEWALANGYADNLTIDRLDGNKDYCPNNCSWATMTVQNNHKSDTKWLTYKGKTQSLSDWCRELGLDYFRTKARLNSLGWSVEDAFECSKYKKESD